MLPIPENDPNGPSEPITDDELVANTVDLTGEHPGEDWKLDGWQEQEADND